MKTKECNHTIGLFYDIFDGYLITINELKQELIDTKDYNEYCKRNNFKYEKLKYTLKDFADFRKNVCMDRFIYCPYCGEKLNWKEMCKS